MGSREEKRKATLIAKLGSEEAYLKAQRENASKGGKKPRPRTFDDSVKAREAVRKSWNKVENKETI